MDNLISTYDPILNPNDDPLEKLELDSIPNVYRKRIKTCFRWDNDEKEERKRSIKFPKKIKGHTIGAIHSSRSQAFPGIL